VIGLQSSIQIQHVNGLEYSCLKQRALKLGQKVKSLHGNNCVRDKQTPSDFCVEIGLPFGFDGPMHAFGTHIDLYTSKRADPIHYKGTQQLLSEITEFAQYCLPLLKQRFHLECKVMQQALHSFDKVSPMYLGGNNRISLSINISHNFANSSHYNSLDWSFHCSMGYG